MKLESFIDDCGIEDPEILEKRLKILLEGGTVKNLLGTIMCRVDGVEEDEVVGNGEYSITLAK